MRSRDGYAQSSCRPFFSPGLLAAGLQLSCVRSTVASAHNRRRCAQPLRVRTTAAAVRTRGRRAYPLSPRPGCGEPARKVHRIAGWSSLVARRAHNPKVVGSNPAPATIKDQLRGYKVSELFLFKSFCGSIAGYFSPSLFCELGNPKAAAHWTAWRRALRRLNPPRPPLGTEDRGGRPGRRESALPPSEQHPLLQRRKR